MRWDTRKKKIKINGIKTHITSDPGAINFNSCMINLCLLKISEEKTLKEDNEVNQKSNSIMFMCFEESQSVHHVFKWKLEKKNRCIWSLYTCALVWYNRTKVPLIHVRHKNKFVV